MPAQLLFKVKDVFSISGEGLILGPGVPRVGPSVKIGDAIEIRRPDGSTLSTKVGGLGMFGGPPLAEAVPLLIPVPGTKEQVPPGSEVWTAPT